MACGCSRRTGKSARPSNAVYELTMPGGTDTKTFLTMLEATRERRRAGGGTIRTVEAPTAVPVPA